MILFENLERSNASEQPVAETNDWFIRALGAVAVNGACDQGPSPTPDVLRIRREATVVRRLR
jgi:hypothetical protein